MKLRVQEDSDDADVQIVVPQRQQSAGVARARDEFGNVDREMDKSPPPSPRRGFAESDASGSSSDSDEPPPSSKKARRIAAPVSPHRESWRDDPFLLRDGRECTPEPALKPKPKPKSGVMIAAAAAPIKVRVALPIHTYLRK